MSREKLVASAAVEPAVDAMAFRDPVFSTLVHSGMRWQALQGSSGFTAARFARYPDLARTRRCHGANHGSSVYFMGFRLAEDLS